MQILIRCDSPTPSVEGKVAENDVTESDGTHTVYRFSDSHYLRSEIIDARGPRPISVTYDRSDSTNTALAMTIRCLTSAGHVIRTVPTRPGYDEDMKAIRHRDRVPRVVWRMAHSNRKRDERIDARRATRRHGRRQQRDDGERRGHVDERRRIERREAERQPFEIARPAAAPPRPTIGPIAISGQTLR